MTSGPQDAAPPRPRDDVDPRLRNFSAQVRDYAILTLDADGRVCTWNEGARLLKGYDEAEILGSPYERFFLPEDAAAGRPAEILQRARTDGSHEEEGWRRRKDGSRFWAHVLITAIRGEDGELVGYGKITEDRTEKRRVQELLDARLAELQRSNAELAQFAYVASHDLSEPLRSIAGYADLLLRRHADALDETAERYLRTISSSTVRMQSLIEAVLAYSLAGRRELEPGPVDLAALVRRVVADLAAAVEASGARVEVEDLPAVRGDAALLTQVLQNLLTNALKFSDGTPEVTVGGRATETGWEVWVADRGIGIPEQYRERIFQLFQRLNPRDAFEGAGVGLAVAQRAVQRHGGELVAEPRPGGGTVMRFTLRDTPGTEETA